MQNLLKILDDLISIQMGTTLSNIIVNDEILEEWLMIAQVEADRFKKEFKNYFLTIKNKDEINFFIRVHLSRLICLSNRLSLDINNNKGKTNSSNNKLLGVQKVILVTIEGLICFIWKNYSQYCNKKQKISQFRKMLLIKKAQETINKCSTSENKLSYIVFTPLRRLLLNHYRDITIERACYMYYLVSIVKKVVIKGDANLLRQHLIHANFNSFSFLTYLAKLLKVQTSKEDTIKGQIEKYYWYLKKINQTHINPDYIFNPGQKGVREFVMDYILEEIAFFEKKLMLSGTQSNKGQIEDSNFKIMTEFSVSQVACFIRLLVDSGAIKNKNKKELINFCAMCIQSKQQENISPESFRSKFYHIEESSRLEIRNLIIQLLNQINKR